MVRIPTFSGRSRSEEAATEERETTTAEDRPAVARTQIDERPVRTVEDRRPVEAAEPTATAEPTTTTEPVTTERATPFGPRARSSLRATVGLILGVVALLAVLSGTLAAAGVALGVLAAVVAAFGLGSTGRPYVAGKADAMLGLITGLAAVVIGVLALNDSIPWLQTDTDQIARFRDWLYDVIPVLDRF